MKYRLLSPLVVLPLVASFFLSSVGFSPAGGADKPNVVLFFVDDMGWADWGRSTLNPQGSDVYETPNMQRLAQRGVVFDNGYASAPVCSPTRVSLLTGKNPARHRVTDFIGAGNGGLGGVTPPANWSQNLAGSDVTLAEALQAGGYATGFFGKWHLGQSGTTAANPLENGFQTNVGGTNSGNPGFAGGFFAGADGAWAGMPGLDNPGTYESTDYLSDAISEKAAEFIADKAAADEPFFVNLSHYVVHTPIQAPANLVTKYTNKIAALGGAGAVAGHDNATYAAMVEKMDQSLGRVLDRLEDPNDDNDMSDSVLDNTIVVFTSDNGGLTQFSVTNNRPLREGKGSMYEGGIREPYLVSWTGSANVQQGVVNSSRVSTHDIYPTLLELTGVSGDAGQNSQMDGVSFSGALAGQQLERKAQLWHYPHYSPQDAGDNIETVDGGQFVSALRDGDWKLLWFYERTEYELYNLGTDIGETNNVLAANPEVALQLSAKLRQRLIAVDAQMPTDAFGRPPAQPVEPPPLALMNRPAEFDPFTNSHNFSAGVAGTPWAGAANASNASDFSSSNGQLTFQNAVNTNLDTNAPFLYQEVTGDFDAQMEISSMTSANFHVLAIVASDPAGDLVWIGQQDRDGENDFAQSRSGFSGVNAEQNLAGIFSHYRLVREADEFRGYVSEDGLFWKQISSFQRADLPATLQVGIAQSSFGASTVTAQVEAFSLHSFDSLPGDYNGDGVVDAGDYTIWRETLNSSTDLRADGDHSGTVDERDYQIWKVQFGQSSTVLSNLSVPTPDSLAFVAVLAVPLAYARRIFA